MARCACEILPLISDGLIATMIGRLGLIAAMISDGLIATMIGRLGLIATMIGRLDGQVCVLAAATRKTPNTATMKHDPHSSSAIAAVLDAVLSAVPSCPLLIANVLNTAPTPLGRCARATASHAPTRMTFR